MKLIVLLVLSLCGSLFFTGCNIPRPGSGELPSGHGIAWNYPGDEGIENHPSVVFADNFETGDIEDIRNRWGHMSNRDGKVMFFSDDVPEGSAGKRSLQMTATRGENVGGELYKTFEDGWDTIYLRFYTKFTEDHGFQGHFVALRGARDPLPYPVGGAGSRAENHFSVTIEPKTTEANKYPTTSHDPSGNMAALCLLAGNAFVADSGRQARWQAQPLLWQFIPAG
jgi:hypothetical protein